MSCSSDVLSPDCVGNSPNRIQFRSHHSVLFSHGFRYWSSHIINFARQNLRRAGSCASARLSICQTVSIIRRRRSHVPGMHMDGVTCILVVIFTWVLDKFPQLFSMHLGQRHTGSRESRKAPPSIASPPVAIHQLTTRTVRR